MEDVIKMIQSNDLLKVALVLLGVYLFATYFYKNKEGVDNVDDKNTVTVPVVQADVKPPVEAPAPSVSQDEHIDKVVAGKTQLQASDLLPKYDDANEFAKQNPVSNLLKEQNFLVSGYHMGINTVVQSNKMHYHDLRSAPPIPKETVGPWAQSSYEMPAGAGRKMLEVGTI
jgi:hypothetical protein